MKRRVRFAAAAVPDELGVMSRKYQGRARRPAHKRAGQFREWPQKPGTPAAASPLAARRAGRSTR
jgi:hypothetical protein